MSSGYPWRCIRPDPTRGPPRRRVLVIGGSFSGLAAGRDLGRHFLVTIIDAKEFGETGEAGASLGLGQL